MFDRTAGAPVGKGGSKEKSNRLGVPARSGKSPVGRGKYKGHTMVTLDDVKSRPLSFSCIKAAVINWLNFLVLIISGETCNMH